MDRGTLVVVDEAGMVGTDDLRQLLNATTAAGVKTVPVGDAHQLAPVKARGGMFAHLCTDLPWTQRCRRCGGCATPGTLRVPRVAGRRPGPGRRAVDWYRGHDRLHPAIRSPWPPTPWQAYRADVAAGRTRC